MQVDSTRYTSINNHQQNARREAGNLFAMLLFWVIMLTLLGSPIWLPIIVEMMVAP